jgi:hypothetical protein
MSFQNEAFPVKEQEDHHRKKEITRRGYWIHRRANAVDMSSVPESKQGVEEIQGED